MARADTSRRDGNGENQVGEVIALVRTYAQQETVDPIKGVGRYLAMGVAGSTLLGIGVILLVLAGLRALQNETGDAFDGNWTWVPYVIVLVVVGLIAALAVSAISRGRRRAGARDQREARP